MASTPIAVQFLSNSDGPSYVNAQGAPQFTAVSNALTAATSALDAALVVYADAYDLVMIGIVNIATAYDPTDAAAALATWQAAAAAANLPAPSNDYYDASFTVPGAAYIATITALANTYLPGAVASDLATIAAAYNVYEAAYLPYAAAYAAYEAILPAYNVYLATLEKAIAWDAANPTQANPYSTINPV